MARPEGFTQPPDIAAITRDDDEVDAPLGQPTAEDQAAFEKRLRPCFEEFLELRRRAVAPEPDDPPVSRDQLASAALLMFKLMIERGMGWVFETYRFRMLVDARTRASAAASDVDFDAIERSYLASMIVSGGIVPPGLQQRLCGGLQALNQGEVQPLLAPVQRGRWRTPYRLAQLRAHALFHLHLRWGRGLIKKTATQQVADALGTSTATIRKWERSWVPGIMGHIDSTLGMAKQG